MPKENGSFFSEEIGLSTLSSKLPFSWSGRMGAEEALRGPLRGRMGVEETNRGPLWGKPIPFSLMLRFWRGRGDGMENVDG